MKAYNPDFIKIILESKKSMLSGKRTRINIDEIWTKDYQKENSSKK
jgi:hypothetical protein